MSERPKSPDGEDRRERAEGDDAAPEACTWEDAVLEGDVRIERAVRRAARGLRFEAVATRGGTRLTVLRLDSDLSGAGLERLREPIETAEALHHPHIMPVRAVGRMPDGRPFIAMVRVPGKSVGSMLRVGPLRTDRAVLIATQCAEALAATHEAGVVHGEFTPEAVFVAQQAQSDEVQVRGFGLATLSDPPETALPFRAPEQPPGEPPRDRRVDVYALGALLYAMLTGAPPPPEAAQALGDPDDSLIDVDGVPRPALTGVLRAALARDPEDRPQTMRALLLALRAATPRLPAPPRFISIAAPLSIPPMSAAPPPTIGLLPNAGSGLRASAADATPKRGWARALILAYVLAQLLIPLSYYVGHDRYDERFAWRMFSGIRVQTCRATVTETVSGREQPVDTRRALQPAWVASLQRNRAEVIERFLQSRCALRGVGEATLVNTCQDADGRALPPQRYVVTCPVAGATPAASAAKATPP
ncbi:MAG: hypothetical protein KC543_12670 [Myxococcales bacterium]|nr:hypothetical protein [Myxococcales bacterium]